MATLYITEFSAVQQYGGLNLQVAQEPPVAEGTVTIGASSSAPYALQKSTALVRVTADAVCSLAVGSNPTATATNRRLVANVEYWLGVPPGGGQKLAVIQNT